MSLRIATWNLQRVPTRPRRDGVQHLMAEQDADVWVLTETRTGVAPGSDYRLVASSGARPDGDADERWVAIWSRLESDMGSRATGDPEYSASAIVNRTTGNELAVYGTVLPWRGRSWRQHPSPGAVAYGAALDVQAEDWRGLMEQCPNVCVAGDFNQDLSDPSYYWSRRARQQLTAALGDSGLAAVTGGSLDPVRQLSSQAAACIDHICLSQALATRLREAPAAWHPVAHGRRVSDHPGVMVTLADA